MTAPKTVVDTQLEHLLEVVERHRETQCGEVLAEARQQARAIVRQAYRTARAHAHADLAALRRQLRQRLVSAEAQQQTRQRQLRQRADQTFLDAAWDPLQQALQRLWQQPEHRQQWVAHLVELAAASLVDRHWLIEHPPDWPAGEGTALLAALDRDCDCDARLEPQPRISAGLRISADGACVDGSIDGLLRRRRHIESLLLAGIRKQQGQPA